MVYQWLHVYMEEEEPGADAEKKELEGVNLGENRGGECGVSVRVSLGVKESVKYKYIINL